MKDRLNDFITIFVCHIGGLMIGFLLILILVTPIRMLTMDFRIRALANFFLQDVITFAALYILFRRTGYSWNRSGEKLLPRSVFINTCISAFAVFAMVLISRLNWVFLYFNSSAFMDFLYANLEGTGNAGMLGIIKLQEEHFPETILTVLVHTFLYIPPMLLGYRCGAKKRSAEREQVLHPHI